MARVAVYEGMGECGCGEKNYSGRTTRRKHFHGELMTCKRKKKVYSPVLGRMVKRCAEYGNGNKREISGFGKFARRTPMKYMRRYGQINGTVVKEVVNKIVKGGAIGATTAIITDYALPKIPGTASLTPNVRVLANLGLIAGLAYFVKRYKDDIWATSMAVGGGSVVVYKWVQNWLGKVITLPGVAPMEMLPPPPVPALPPSVSAKKTSNFGRFWCESDTGLACDSVEYDALPGEEVFPIVPSTHPYANYQVDVQEGLTGYGRYVPVYGGDEYLIE